MITPRSGAALALWLAKNEPEIFAIMEREANAKMATLSGWSDVLSNIGTGISNAASAVGSYLTSSQGANTLTSLASTYLAGKQQKNVLNTQLALAQAGLPPAPITNTIGANNQVVPVYTPTNQVATNQVLMSLQPSFLDKYKIPIIAGGAGLILLIALMR